jgi:hypothetical protein
MIIAKPQELVWRLVDLANIGKGVDKELDKTSTMRPEVKA